MNMRTPVDTGTVIPALTTIIYEQKAEIAELKRELEAERAWASRMIGRM